MKLASEFVMWLFVGALVVLVVTHSTGFATAVSAVGGQVDNSATILTGAGVRNGVNPPTPMGQVGG